MCPEYSEFKQLEMEPIQMFMRFEIIRFTLYRK